MYLPQTTSLRFFVLAEYLCVVLLMRFCNLIYLVICTSKQPSAKCHFPWYRKKHNVVCSKTQTMCEQKAEPCMQYCLVFITVYDWIICSKDYRTDDAILAQMHATGILTEVASYPIRPVSPTSPFFIRTGILASIFLQPMVVSLTP